jgi:hypothetical protein
MLVSIMYSYFMATGLTYIIVIDVNHPNIGGIGDFLFCYLFDSRVCYFIYVRRNVGLI